MVSTKAFTLAVIDRSLIGGIFGCVLAACNFLVNHYRFQSGKFTVRVVKRMGRVVVKGGIMGIIFGLIFGGLSSLV